MNKLRYLSILLIFICVFASFSPALADEDSEFSVKAKAALLVDVDTGTVLYAQSIQEKLYPASLTKIMTALLALEHGDLNDIVTVSSGAVTGLDPSGSTANLLAGEQLRLKDLLYCILVTSANEACNVIAEYVSGDVDSFVSLMNRRAAELGCTGTHFTNPHGLHDEDHYTTAWDSCLITMEALKNPVFAEICNTTSYEVPATNKSDERLLMTTNYLLSNQKVTGYLYEYARGVKTGHTSPAGFCLVSTATRNETNLISVVMGAESVVLEGGITEIQSFTETARLFEWGFKSFSEQVLVDEMEPVYELPVSLAADVDSVVLCPSQAISALMPNEFDSDELNRVISIYNSNLTAPVEEGAVLGSMEIYYNEKLLGSTELVALTEVKMSSLIYYTESAKNFLSQTWVRVVMVFLIVLAVVCTLLAALVITRNKRSRSAIGNTYKGSSLKKTSKK